MIAARDCAYGLARYAAIAQNAGLVPIIEPEVGACITLFCVVHVVFAASSVRLSNHVLVE